ncbi:MAG: sensor histidine kinase [Rhizomicrobium sp.]
MSEPFGACDARLDAALADTFPASDPVAISTRGPASPGHPPLQQRPEPLNDPWTYMAEIAHRTINEYTVAIAMVARAASGVSDRHLRSALQGVELRLRNAARAQQILSSPPRTGRIDLADYLQPLCAAISSFALGEEEIFLTLSCESIGLSATQCWRVGLIVSELIMNARRHAFDGRGGIIRVEATREGREIVCRVLDNGAGMKDFVPGRGSKLVEALAADLGGTIRRPPSESGTSVQLLFPPE